MGVRTLPFAWAAGAYPPNQTRRTPLLLTGFDGRSSVMGLSTLPYIHVSSANTSFALATAALSTTPYIIIGNSSTHLRKGGIPQWLVLNKTTR